MKILEVCFKIVLFISHIRPEINRLTLQKGYKLVIPSQVFCYQDAVKGSQSNRYLK